MAAVSSNSACVSIHASVKDATSFHSLNQPDFTVSIHASVKDATFKSYIPSFHHSFNPRICKRCDSNLQEEQYLAVEFQSTHL